MIAWAIAASLGISRDVLDERRVDLEGADREALQVTERGVAGPEIVDRRSDAEALSACSLAAARLGLRMMLLSVSSSSR
jgi:hypothetical protein